MRVIGYALSQAQRCVVVPLRSIAMKKIVRGGIAGFAAWKWGGGIIGTILIFLIVFYLLGFL